MTLKLEHCQPFATAVASSGENIRSSGEPGKGESGRLVGQYSTVCGIVPVLPTWLGGGWVGTNHKTTWGFSNVYLS